jgi:tRNA A-37 threonylcarbamoyl transferase component Bud32
VLDLTAQTPPMPVPSRFVREETIGEGAVASTYRARDLVAGRAVTLVQVRPEQAADAFFLARFAREAHLLATIDHPNVVRVVASGIEHSVPFVATEYVSGRTLAEIVAARGPLAVAEVVGLARQLLAGLGAIHAVGLLHLRLTPRTVLIGDDGVVRLTHVGIASLAGTDDGSERGAAVEVARYLAPELIEGGDVYEGTDLYAVGAILFEALTGRPPFPGDNAVLVRFAQVQAPPPVPSRVVTTGIPPELDAAVLCALAKDPARRYADARAMAAALPAGKAATGADRVMSQRPVGVVAPPGTSTAFVWPVCLRPGRSKQRPDNPPNPSGRSTRFVAERAVAGARPIDAVGSGRVGRRRQASGEWVWPIVIACVAIGVLIGALAASLSGDAPADEAAAGVSVDAKGSGQPTVTTPGLVASTPTARVVRPSNQGEAAVPTGNAFRAQAGAMTKTPRPTKTPKAGDRE